MSANRLRVLLVSVLAVFAISMIASASASASPIWEVCEKGGTEEFETHRCAQKGAGGDWSWKYLELSKAYNVVSKGGTQELVLDTAGAKPVIACEHVSDQGNIKGGAPGTDEVTELKYTECKINLPSCPVVKTAGEPSGTVAVPSGVKSELFEESGVIKDRFSPASGTTLVTLEIGKKENGSKEAEGICSPLPAVNNKVEGTAVATVDGKNLNFTGEGTLTMDGVASELKGLDEQELENGAAFRAVKGPPLVTFIKGNLAFGGVKVLVPKKESFVFENKTENVTYEQAYIETVKGTEAFTIVSGKDTCSKKGIIAPGTCTIEVEFLPTAEEEFEVRLNYPYESAVGKVKFKEALLLTGKGE